MALSLLVIIVEKAQDFTVLDALDKAGISAVTFLTGTGAGVWHTLSREVDPEKTIIMSVVDRAAAPEALKALETHGGLGQPGRGIAFSVPVDQGIGVGLPGYTPPPSD